MPLYDFHCPACDHTFEAHTGFEEPPPACPACGQAPTERLLSGFAGPFTRRPRGLEARRADGVRRAKDEQRKERMANRAEQRRKGL